VNISVLTSENLLVFFLAAIFSVYVEHNKIHLCVSSAIHFNSRQTSFDQIRVYSQVFSEHTSYFLDAVFVTIYLYKIRNPLEECGFLEDWVLLKGLRKTDLV
jgi:hypothetical protein